MKTITLAQLRGAHACEKQTKLFARLFGNEVVVSVETAISVADKFTWDWAATHLLPAPALDAYLQATTPALDVYQQAVTAAKAAYRRTVAMATAEAVYDQAMASALAAYRQAKAAAFAEAYLSDAA